MGLIENDNINKSDGLGAPYETGQNPAIPKGADPSKINSGQITTSAINKLHLIKLADNFPYNESDIAGNDKFKIRDFTDLCKLDTGAMQYDVDDFLYCKNIGFPINKLITLRRFPYPCTDNIWDKEVQGEPDIARMVTYYSQEVNKLDELLSYSYAMKWKELNAEFEQNTMQGDQTGVSGFMKKALKAFDPELYKNQLRGDNANMLDPKFDQNKVYGPVDSIINTNIRDVGLEFNKEFDISFEYELKSWEGRTPEYAMKDLLSNILACTFNNGKFWPGARYWVGDRPSGFYKRMQYLNSDDMDAILTGAYGDLKSVLNEFSTAGSAVDTLKKAIKGGAALAMGKILDKVGRPGILTMNSLLSGEPTGFWHLTIGDPLNPTMCIGNLICTGVDVNFPTDSLSYGNFPTKMSVKVKLKPGQSKDRAGIEMMWNMGKHRIYYAPKKLNVDKNKNNISKTSRSFFNFDNKEIDNALTQTYDFIADGVNAVTKTTIDSNTVLTNNDTTSPNQSNSNLMQENNDLG